MTIVDFIELLVETVPATGIAIFAIYVLNHAYREWLRDIHQVREEYREDNKILMKALMDVTAELSKLNQRLDVR